MPLSTLNPPSMMTSVGLRARALDLQAALRQVALAVAVAVAEDARSGSARAGSALLVVGQDAGRAAARRRCRRRRARRSPLARRAQAGLLRVHAGQHQDAACSALARRRRPPGCGGSRRPCTAAYSRWLRCADGDRQRRESAGCCRACTPAASARSCSSAGRAAVAVREAGVALGVARARCRRQQQQRPRRAAATAARSTRADAGEAHVVPLRHPARAGVAAHRLRPTASDGTQRPGPAEGTCHTPRVRSSHTDRRRRIAHAHRLRRLRDEGHDGLRGLHRHVPARPAPRAR